MSHRVASRILIAGHGYLGQALAELLTSQNQLVTTISLSGTGSDYACDLSQLDELQPLVQKWQDHHTLPDYIVLCTSSPKGSGLEGYEQSYLKSAQNIIQLLPNSKLIFTSSTSVYAQQQGEVVTEESEALGAAKTGKVLRQTEDLILKHAGLVLRLAGIYGPRRSFLLKKFIKGEASIEEQGSKYINHVHRDDVVSAIEFFIKQHQEQGAWKGSEIYNVCDSNPLTQQECYTSLAEIFQLPYPPSKPKNTQTKRGWSDKQVSNAKLCALGWSPQYPYFSDAAQEVANTLDL